MRADFSRSNLQSCVFSQCHLAGVNFDGADLRGAKFPHTVFADDNIFTGAQSDASTDFQNVPIERAASRLPVFRFFEYGRGGLLKRRAGTLHLTGGSAELTVRAAGEGIVIRPPLDGLPPIVGVEGTSQARQLGPVLSDGSGGVENGSTTDRWDNVWGRLALLEATLAAPKTGGIGHNHGPSINPNAEEDEAEIKLFIDRLSDMRTGTVVADPSLIEDAEDLLHRAERGTSLIEELAKGVAKGSGASIGKKIVDALADAPWWHNVYTLVKSLVRAFIDAS